MGPKAIKKTNEIYDTMKKSADPNYAQQVAVRPDFEEATLNTLTLVSIIQDYIRNHPNTKELPPSLRQYDSMKGVRLWTLSDEGAEMTRDFAILAAGFIATMGTSAILGGAVL